MLKPLVNKRPLTAKIERPEAFSFLNNIAKNFDSIWLCRGDLAAQAGIKRLGYLQDQFIQTLSSKNNHLYLAGQVMEHLTHFKSPTRSEVVHLYHTINQGYQGIVLSDETAIGIDPFNAVKTTHWLCQNNNN